MSHIKAISDDGEKSVTIYDDYDFPQVHFSIGGEVAHAFQADDIQLHLLKEALDTYFMMQAEREKAIAMSSDQRQCCPHCGTVGMDRTQGSSPSPDTCDVCGATGL